MENSVEDTITKLRDFLEKFKEKDPDIGTVIRGFRKGENCIIMEVKIGGKEKEICLPPQKDEIFAKILNGSLFREIEKQGEGD